MNFVSKKDIYGNSKNLRPNTFIGGIAKLGGTGVNAPIRTVTQLAQKLGINATRITGFRIVNNDVECRIKGNYLLTDFGNNDVNLANQNITSFIDLESLVTGQSGTRGFGNCNSMQLIKLNAIQIATSIFRECMNSSLTVEMTALKKTLTSPFISQLPSSFNQSKLVGFPLLEELGQFCFHNVPGFTEIQMESAKKVFPSTFYTVTNAEKFILNNVTSLEGSTTGAWRHGSRKCKLIELKKCKLITGDIVGYDASTNVVHATDFKMKLNAVVRENTSVLNFKSKFPHAILEFYDDNNNLVSTL